MSHTVTTTTKIKNLQALKDACANLGLSLQLGPQSVRLYGNSVDCNASVKLKDWNYPVAINTQTGEIKYDNYNGSWGNIKELDNFVQNYTSQVVQQETAELVAQGWQQDISKLENGDLQVVLTHA